MKALDKTPYRCYNIFGCGRNSAVECHLPKVDVEGSSPFARSINRGLRDQDSTTKRWWISLPLNPSPAPENRVQVPPKSVGGFRCHSTLARSRKSGSSSTTKRWWISLRSIRHKALVDFASLNPCLLHNFAPAKLEQ